MLRREKPNGGGRKAAEVLLMEFSKPASLHCLLGGRALGEDLERRKDAYLDLLREDLQAC